MNERIVYEMDGGGITVMHPTGIEPLADIIATKVPAGKAHKIIDVSEIPQDRVFRDAWEMPGSAIQVNLGRAKEIAHGWRREKRVRDFAPLDIQATIPSQAQAAERARQVIRDIDALLQTDIDNAADEAALRVYALPLWPGNNPDIVGPEHVPVLI